MYNQEIENKLIDFAHKKEGKDYPIHDIKVSTAVDFILENKIKKSKQEKDNLIENMCLSYRHDFGLMIKEQQDKLRSECEKWLHIFEKNK